MLRLVETHFASTWKPDPGDRTPSCFLHFGTSDALLPECRDLGLQIVTHEIEFVPGMLLGGMNRQFRRREGEDPGPIPEAIFLKSSGRLVVANVHGPARRGAENQRPEMR